MNTKARATAPSWLPAALDYAPLVLFFIGYKLLGVLGGGAARGDQAGDEEQRVTRQHGEQHTRLDEDDQQQSDERPRAEPTDQVERVQDARQCHGIGGGLHQRQVVHGPQGYRRGAERGLKGRKRR